MVVYFISGLGADERVFANLSFPENVEVIHLKWFAIAHGETLLSYAKKFANTIDTTKPFSIVGLSFGGILAVEISKIINPQKLILLSSISTKNELPFLFKVIGAIGLNKRTPAFLLNKIYPFTHWYFGTKTPAEKRLLQQIIHDTSSVFLKWAINEIVNWQNKIRPANILHIHGSSDKIFPVSKTKADVIIANGGHFMVYNKAGIVNKLLLEKLGL